VQPNLIWNRFDPNLESSQMLSRLYIDNFRGFVNFEHRPARRELILGTNGSGKSSFLDALLLLRQIAVTGNTLDDYGILHQRTRWSDQARVTWELDAELDEGKYKYRLVIEPWGDPLRPRIATETVHCERKPIFEFTNGEVRIYNDKFEHKVSYEFDWHRSALATMIPRGDNQLLSRFRQWLVSLFCFRINPFVMGSRTDSENLYPNVDLSNIASWYRHHVQADPRQNAALLDSLREAVDGFDVLRLESAGENVRLLLAEFRQPGGKMSKFALNELSDGQRCLLALYMILHFVIAKGGTVVLDEPDNFISLREIQPWLMAVTDSVEDNKGQVLIISHHPEIINQWAPANGVQFFREASGPVRVERFSADSSSSLLPSELVARGWERE
jgi:predicted ATPase